MTVKALAQALGVADNTVYRWENDRHIPLNAFQEKLDHVLG